MRGTLNWWARRVSRGAAEAHRWAAYWSRAIAFIHFVRRYLQKQTENEVSVGQESQKGSGFDSWIGDDFIKAIALPTDQSAISSASSSTGVAATLDHLQIL